MKRKRKRRRCWAPTPREFIPLLGANLTNSPALGKRIPNLEVSDSLVSETLQCVRCSVQIDNRNVGGSDTGGVVASAHWCLKCADGPAPVKSIAQAQDDLARLYNARFEAAVLASREARNKLAQCLKAKNPTQATERFLEFEGVEWLQRQLDAAIEKLRSAPYSIELQRSAVVLARQLDRDCTVLVYRLNRMGALYGTK